MVAQPTNSEPQTPKGGKRSSDGEKFLPSEHLVFLTQDLFNYIASGGTMQIFPDFMYRGRRAVAILLYDTQIVDGAIVPLVAHSEPGNDPEKK